MPSNATPQDTHTAKPSTDPKWGGRDTRNEFPELMAGKPGKRDKRAAFVRLGNARLLRIVKALRVLGSLANRSAYDFDDKDVKAIFAALDGEMNKIAGKFGAALDRKSNDEKFDILR